MTANPPRIELVYHRGCPNADTARENLGRALDSLKLEAGWSELVQEDQTTPAWAKRLPSPTVLVEGRSVAGGGWSHPAADATTSDRAEAAPDPPGRGAHSPVGPSCAPGGAPSVEEILSALVRRGGDQ